MRACSLSLCYQQQQQQMSMATVPLTWSLGRGGVGDTRMMDMYSEYADTATADESPSTIKARLSALSAFAESQGLTGQAAFDGLRSLCSQLQAELLDTRNFALFYHFVFFMCRERGQKSISVSTAVNGWRLALTGRFRLLDQWCAFVQVHQRHAISEDTWRQVLEFSRSVHEDLSNYDPEGAWPVLVDEFVDSMYRKNACSRCSKDTHRICDCGVDAMPMLNTDDSSLTCRPSTLPGMAAQAGSKRRWQDPIEEAAQAESVNCLSQRLAKMPSPLITKRMRTSGAEAASVSAAAAAASDPMEDELQEAQGITIWEHHRDRASHVSNHHFAQASMLGQDLPDTSGYDAPSWQPWPSHQGNRRWGQIHGSNSHVLLPKPGSTPSSACGGYPAFLSPQQDLLLHQ